MNKQNDYVFSIYKPFRNQIRKYNLIDSLFVIWCYSRNLTFNKPFPDGLQMLPGYQPQYDLNTRRHKGIPEFELEFLLREFILNCETNPSKYTLRNKINLSNLLNYLHFSFSEKIDENFALQGDFLIEFNRMAHRQFKWQDGYNPRAIFRYYKIFADPEVNSIILNKYKLTTYQLFIIGVLFFNLSAENFITPLPLNLTIPMITNEMIELFLQYFSIPIEIAKIEIKEHQQMNENIFYSYNPLLAKPILTSKNSFLCPIQLLLFFQFTGGIYYNIVKEKGFENAFGSSFQSYIGEVLYKCCNNPSLKIIAEEKYGKQVKRTTDWILLESNAVLFIECKAKRMTFGSKSELDLDGGLKADLEKMATFITQIYKTYIDYTKGKYPNLPFHPSITFFPLIVTLEDWYINLNPSIAHQLHSLVIANVEANNLDSTLIERFPYHIRSTADFERDIQLINTLGIHEYFDKLANNTLNDFIKGFRYNNPFEDEIDKTFFEPFRQQPSL